MVIETFRKYVDIQASDCTKWFLKRYITFLEHDSANCKYIKINLITVI